jgi:hypothetical protein
VGKEDGFFRIKVNSMRVRKADGNQSALVRQIRQIPGLMVRHTHTVGQGFVDAVIGYGGKNYLLEIKDPSKPPSQRKLTPDEQKFHDEWTGQVAVVETLDDVLRVIGMKKICP